MFVCVLACFFVFVIIIVIIIVILVIVICCLVCLLVCLFVGLLVCLFVGWLVGLFCLFGFVLAWSGLVLLLVAVRLLLTSCPFFVIFSSPSTAKGIFVVAPVHVSAKVEQMDH